MYADTDFFIALLKDQDWLKQQALELLKKYKGDISTSVVTVMEHLFLCAKFDIDPEEALLCLFQIAKVEGIDEGKALCSAHLMKKFGLGPLDAMHACWCNGVIISSDKAFDKVGIKRIALHH